MGIHGPIASELAKRKHVPALEWLGDYYAGYYSDDYSFSIDRDKATEILKKIEGKEYAPPPLYDGG